MSRTDNTAHLRVAARARHDHAVQRTRDAIRTLDRHGQPITFTTVAAAAHVSRTWLYRQPDLRADITDHRQPQPGATPAAQRATTASTTARLDALRTEIEHLRAENAILRDHVARALGQRRAQPHPAIAEPDPPPHANNTIARLHAITNRPPQHPPTPPTPVPPGPTRHMLNTTPPPPTPPVDLLPTTPIEDEAP